MKYILKYLDKIEKNNNNNKKENYEKSVYLQLQMIWI